MNLKGIIVHQICLNLNETDENLFQYLESSMKKEILEKSIERFTINDQIIDRFFISTNLQELDLSGSNNLLTDSILEKISTQCVNLKSLSIFRCTSFSRESILKALENLDALTNLNLSRTNTYDEHLFSIAKNMKSLGRLVLNKLIITDDGLIQVIKNCSQLKILSLSACRKVKKKKKNNFFHLNFNPFIYFLQIDQ